MSRDPRVRKDYMKDAQNLLQLTRAIKSDDKRPVEWRNDVIDGLKNLAEKLIKAPSVDTQLDLIVPAKDSGEHV